MKAIIILDLDDNWVKINKFTLDELFADITLYEKKALNGQCDYQKRVYRCFDGCLKPMPKGEWIRDFDGNEFYWYCSNCKENYYEHDLYLGGNEFPNFCPNCGADMRGEEE